MLALCLRRLPLLKAICLVLGLIVIIAAVAMVITFVQLFGKSVLSTYLMTQMFKSE